MAAALRGEAKRPGHAPIASRQGNLRIYDFRVTVRRITGDGRKQISYNVFVDELRDGRPYRGKAYLGGYGEKWIDQFTVRASADFPQAWTAPGLAES